MNWLLTALLALVLLLAPIYAATPDEPLYSSLLCAATLLALVVAVATDWRGSRQIFAGPSRPVIGFALLLGLAFLSLLLRLILEHGVAYLGAMTRGWTLLATDFALFVLSARMSKDRGTRYALLLAALAGAAIVANIGVQEYVFHLRKHESSWRIFGTSTPDYLAGYFVLLIPVNLAFFLHALHLRLSALLRSALSLLFGLVLLFLLAAMLTTQSRTALAALTVSLVVFALAVLRAARNGLILSRGTRYVLLGAGACVLLGGLAFAKPLLTRLHTLNDNSTAFRLWTWKGAAHMAAANPLLGTGIGTWADLYPPYALTGFTRLAHDSYLQMADECGLPALLVLLATLGLIGAALWRGLALRPSAPMEETAAPAPLPSRKSRRPAQAAAAPAKSPWLETILPPDDRLILCGLLAGLAAGLVQNLIDSDWYVFFLGTTFWAMTGLGLGMAAPQTSEAGAARPLPRPALAAVGILAALLLWVSLAQGIGASFAESAQADMAQTPPAPLEAVKDYDAAKTWDPLNAHPYSEQGYKVFPVLNDYPSAEADAHAAVGLEPNSVNYRRLGSILQTEGHIDEAIAAFQQGLRAEPNSLDILLDLAHITPTPQSLVYYQKIADLETTPVGTVRAIGEIVETKFAVADAVMGDQAAATDPAKAIAYYTRAQATLESFADEGGTTNFERQAIIGGHPDPHWDNDMRDLYQHVMAARIRLAAPDQQSALIQQRETYGTRFDKVFANASQSGTL